MVDPHYGSLFAEESALVIHPRQGRQFPIVLIRATRLLGVFLAYHLQ